MIVAFTGLLEDSHGNRRIAGAGKDEAAKVLVDNGFVSVAFADIMKRWCKELFGFTDEQLWGPSAERAKEDERYPRFPLNMMYACKEVDGDRIGEYRDTKDGREFVARFLTVRYALQKLGDWGRDCYPDIWANKALEIAKKILKKPHNCRYTPQEGLSYDNISYNGVPLIGDRSGVVIPDCRFQNEFRRVKEEGGYIIRVKRFVNEFPDKLDDSHISERDILAWDDDQFDNVIKNNGTVEELRAEVARQLNTRLEMKVNWKVTF